MTTTWPTQSSTGSSSAAARSRSMGRRCAPNNSQLTMPRHLRHQIHRPEFPESTGQNFRNPHMQVKSQESPVDTPTLHQLVGSMQNVGADQGLLVAWGGFKSSVDRETP